MNRTEVEELEQLCAERQGYKVADLRNRGREDWRCVARWTVMRQLRETLLLTHAAIADVYGMNRSNVTLGLRALQNRMDTDPQVRQKVEAVAAAVAAAAVAAAVAARKWNGARMETSDLRKIAAKLPLSKGTLALNGIKTEAPTATVEAATITDRKDGRSDNLVYNPKSVTAFFATYQIPAPRFEFHFCPERKFRFDLAWPDYLCAVEVQGGIWTRGAHTRGAALLREMEKLRIAAGLGWRVLPCTPDQLLTAEVARAVKAAIFFKG